jgi:hypothetical protein
MASIANQVLDDELVGGGDTTFVGGQASATIESSIPAGSYASAVNMDIDPFGRLSTRRGARTLTGNTESRNWDAIAVNWNANTNVWGNSLGSTAIDAAFYYDTDASETIVVAQGGALKQGTEGGAWATITSATYSGSDVYFAQLNNRLYYCDASGALKYIDSSYGYNAITAGKVTSIKITTQGIGYNAVPAITFTHNGGASGAATAILGYGGRVVGATVTTAGSGYSATTPPTIAFAAAPAGGTTALGLVNISQLPSKPKFLVSHTNRLFCCSADTSIPPDTVYASYFLDGESWDLVGGSVRVGGDGDPITGLFSWFGNKLLVFKQRSIWVINADPTLNASDWEITQITGRIGCVGHRTVQSVGSDVYFLAQDGVRAISQIQAGTQTDVGQPLSAPVQDIIDRINKSYLSQVRSAFYRNRYFLALPVDSGTTPSVVLVWNELSRSWLGSWTGWSPSEFVVTGFSGRIRLNFGDTTGKFWTWDDYTAIASETSSQYRDDATDYESYIITRAYDLGDPLVNKLGYIVQFTSENRLTDASVTVYLSYSQDISGSFTSLDSSVTMSAGDRQKRRSLPLVSYGKFNVIQFKFGATRLKASLANLAVTAFVDPIETEVST